MEMKRKIGILFAGIALALGIVAGHVSAYYANCTTGPNQSNFSWIGSATGTVYERTGTNAVIDPASTQFHPCTNSTTDGLSTAWVALTPDEVTDHNAIAQIGWLKSNVGICDGGNADYCIVFAIGGCGYEPIAVDTDLYESTSPGQPATFQVESSGGYIHFYYDLSGGHNYHELGVSPFKISTTPGLACWAGSDMESAFFAERHNPYDGIGSSSSPSTWSDMTTKYNNNWVTNDPAGCNWMGANGDQGAACSLPSAGTMHTWNGVP